MEIKTSAVLNAAEDISFCSRRISDIGYEVEKIRNSLMAEKQFFHVARAVKAVSNNLEEQSQMLGNMSVVLGEIADMYRNTENRIVNSLTLEKPDLSFFSSIVPFITPYYHGTPDFSKPDSYFQSECFRRFVAQVSKTENRRDEIKLIGTYKGSMQELVRSSGSRLAYGTVKKVIEE